jgi:hypothetical protein
MGKEDVTSIPQRVKFRGVGSRFFLLIIMGAREI